MPCTPPPSPLCVVGVRRSGVVKRAGLAIWGRHGKYEVNSTVERLPVASELWCEGWRASVAFGFFVARRPFFCSFCSIYCILVVVVVRIQQLQFSGVEMSGGNARFRDGGRADRMFLYFQGRLMLWVISRENMEYKRFVCGDMRLKRSIVQQTEGWNISAVFGHD